MSEAVLTEHAALGGSTAERWMACPGSVRLGKDIPSVSSWYADEGSAAHKVLELVLSEELAPRSFVGAKINGVLVDEEMVNHIENAADYIYRLKGDRQMWTETRLDLARLGAPAPMFGTADVLLYDAADKTLHVIDLKYGRGEVAIDGNAQLLYYAVGAVLTLEDCQPENVVITILQPRSRAGRLAKSKMVSIHELRDFGTKVINAATQTTDENPPLKRGRHCRYCPAKSICPLHQALA